MQVVLLCAGMGTRLGERTRSLPKTLLEIGGRTVLDRILKSVELDETDEIIVVGGFEIDKLRGHLDGYRGRPVRVVENPEYAEGSVLTIARALPFINGDFVLMNGDHIHPREMVHKFITGARAVSCAVDRDRLLTGDDMKVRLDPDGRVGRMDKKLTEYDRGYIGMTFCDRARLDLYREYLEITLSRHGRMSNVEKIVQCMADDGISPRVVDLSGFGWLEIDDERDYRRAIDQLAANPYLRSLV